MKMFLSLLCSGLLLGPVFAQKATIEAGNHDAAKVVISVPIAAPGANAVKVGVATLPAQAVGNNLVFVLPELKAQSKVTIEPMTLNYLVAPTAFEFKATDGEYVDVMFGKKAVLRYVNKPRTEADHYMTFKPFHQMFDPAEGKTLLNSGAHPLQKPFLFPHHRGLFFGFNRISYGDKQTADIWHGKDNVFSNHDKMLGTIAGEVLSKHVSEISWHGKDGNTFATEERSVTVYNTPGGTLLDWGTMLSTELPKVRLDGDPQHAGFHFRASQEVAQKTAKQSYYLRPDGKGKLGETRNWIPNTKKGPTNQNWNALSFVVEDKRYTVVRLVHPTNPKETRGSERDYGRFGDYFEYDLTPDNPLKLSYRIWLQEGEMTVDECNALYAGFTGTHKVLLMK